MLKNHLPKHSINYSLSKKNWKVLVEQAIIAVLLEMLVIPRFQNEHLALTNTVTF